MKTTTSVPPPGLVQMVARMIPSASLIALGFVNGALMGGDAVDQDHACARPDRRDGLVTT
jgi:hypothetical protein